MVENDSNLVPKSSGYFSCDCCNYVTSRQSQFVRHLETPKHKNGSKMIVNDSDLEHKSSKLYYCNCGKAYKYDSGYYRHKKTCSFEEKTALEQAPIQQSITPELVMELIKNNKELQQIILEQHTTLNNLVKNGVSNNITTSLNNSNNVNNNNKTFNLQFFLNETCKDAMNIMDFVDSIKLQLSDLEKIGEIGYTQGI